MRYFRHRRKAAPAAGPAPLSAAVFYLVIAGGIGFLAAGCGLFSGPAEPPDHVSVLLVREVHSHLLSPDAYVPEIGTSRLEPHIPQVILTPAQGDRWRSRPGQLLVLRRIEHLHQVVGEELSTAGKFPYSLPLDKMENAPRGVVSGSGFWAGSVGQSSGAGSGTGGLLLPGGLNISSHDGGHTVVVDYQGYGASLEPGEQWRIVFAADGSVSDELSDMEAMVEKSLDDGLPIVLLEVNFAGRWAAGAVTADDGGGGP